MRLLSYFLVVFVVWSAVAAAAAPTAYVVNSNGETLSRIDLAGGTVTQNIVTLGTDIQSAPNQIVVLDTLALVVVSLTDEIQVINLKTETTEAFISTGASSNPYWMEVYNSQFLYVSLLLSDAVLKIDYVNQTVVDTIPVGKSPAGLAIHDQKLYVANSGFDFGTFLYDPGTISVIDLTTDQAVATIPVGLNPQSVLVDRGDRVHVICTGDYFSVFGAAYIIESGSGSVVDSVLLGGSPAQATIGPDGIVYASAGGFSSANGYVYSYDALTATGLHTQANPLLVGQGCVGVTAFQDSTVLASSLNDFVSRIDLNGSNLNSYPVGDGPVHIDFNYQLGDINGDFAVNLTDLTKLVNHLFVTFEPLPQPTWRANVNGDFKLGLTDLTVLVNHLFVNFQPLTYGPRWYNP